VSIQFTYQDVSVTLAADPAVAISPWEACEQKSGYETMVVLWYSVRKYGGLLSRRNKIVRVLALVIMLTADWNFG